MGTNFKFCFQNAFHQKQQWLPIQLLTSRQTPLCLDTSNLRSNVAVGPSKTFKYQAVVSEELLNYFQKALTMELWSEYRSHAIRILRRRIRPLGEGEKEGKKGDILYPSSHMMPSLSPTSTWLAIHKDLIFVCQRILPGCPNRSVGNKTTWGDVWCVSFGHVFHLILKPRLTNFWIE